LDYNNKDERLMMSKKVQFLAAVLMNGGMIKVESDGLARMFRGEKLKTLPQAFWTPVVTFDVFKFL